MSYTYSTFVTYLSTETVIPQTDPNFIAIVPLCIDYAEQRVYRELNLLNTVVRDSSAQLTANNRTFTLPSSLGRFVAVNGINVITPPSATNPDNGTRNQLMLTSRDAVDNVWPSTSGAAVPAIYAMVTDVQALVGPAPDQAYTAEVIGTIRPTPLSASNVSTYLTLYLPDLFFAAAMVFMSGYMRNFGSQADDPKMAQSWETQYQALFSSANEEEQRKRFGSGAWGAAQPATATIPGK